MNNNLLNFSLQQQILVEVCPLDLSHRLPRGWSGPELDLAWKDKKWNVVSPVKRLIVRLGHYRLLPIHCKAGTVLSRPSATSPAAHPPKDEHDEQGNCQEAHCRF